MGEATVPAEQSASGQEARVSTPDVDASGPGHPALTAPEGPRPPVGLTWRIRDRATFTALRRQPRVRRGPVSVAFLRAPDGPPRVAYAIGRAAGPAVARNRLRRRLRAIVATVPLSPGAYLIAAGPEAGGLAFTALAAVVGDGLRAAGHDRRGVRC